MSQREAGEEQVKFRDVAACFSEKEWKNLQEWQKDFYKNVMKEIHQALIVLGYQILNPDSLLRIDKGIDEPGQEAFEDQRWKINEGIASSHPTLSPDVLFRIAHEEKSYCRDGQLPEDAEVGNSSGSCSPVVSSAFFASEEEFEPYPLRHQDSERRESNHRSSRFPSSQTDLSWRKKGERKASSSDRPEAGREVGPEPNTGYVVVPEVLVVTVSEDDDVYSVDEEDCEIIESSDELTGDAGVNQHTEAALSKQGTPGRATDESSVWEEKARVFRSSHHGPNIRCPRQSETFQETRRGKASQRESGFSISEQCALLPGSPRSREELESYLRNSLLRNGLPNSQHNQMAYRTADFDRIYLQKRELTRRVMAYSGVGPYECTECEKRFFNKSNLKKHYRTHTGERPHKCTFCHKRFSRTDNLNRHIRIHTRRLKRQTL